jgi:hypothetical protein
MNALPWTTDLGIIGLTVSSLISLLFYVIISSNKREDRRNVQFQKTIHDVNELHRDERSEWKEDASVRQDKSTQALSELTRAINEVLVTR